jgi:thioester reductase-like protein
MGVFQRTGYTRPVVLDELSPLRTDDVLTESEGYAETKWVAERMVQRAGERGVPVAIYRPGRVTGDSRSGRWSADDMGFRMLYGCVLLKMAPVIPRLKIDIAPVDFVSRAIIELSLQRDVVGGVFHLINNEPIDWEDLIGWLQRFGYQMRRTTIEEWLGVVRQLGGTTNPMAPLVEPVGKSVLEGYFADYRCARTVERLAGAVTCPEITDELLSTFVRGLIADGLMIPPPNGAP